MQPYEYSTMHQLEDTYWWYAGLRRLIGSTFKKLPKQILSGTLLDAGCGTGGTLAYLKQNFKQTKIFAFDIHPSALHWTHLRKTDVPLLQASVEQIPSQKNTFNIITCLDVICLREISDLNAFQEFHRILKPGGILLLNLPAYEFLRGEHDAAVYTRHRYTARELSQKLKATGFAIKRITYWNTLLFPFVLIWRKMSARKKTFDQPKSDLIKLPSLMNELLKLILRIEEMLTFFLDLPFGTSVFAVAQKPL